MAKYELRTYYLLAAMELLGHNDLLAIEDEGRIRVQTLDEVDIPTDKYKLVASRAKEMEAADDLPNRLFSKKRLFESMTDAEYDKWEANEKLQNKRKARMFREAGGIAESDPSFPELRAVMVATYGEERTVQLLNASKI